jgi:ribose transport system substrate-binding protein
MGRATTGRAKFATVLALASLLLIAAACGSDNKSSSQTATTAAATTAAKSGSASSAPSASTASSASGGATEAQQVLAKLLVKPTQLPTTEKIGKPVPSGKKIAWIVCGAPECAALTKPLTEAATTLGWTIQSIDGGLTPETVQAAWNLAVQSKPDAVVATGFPSVMFSEPLAKLAAMNIPVVNGYVTDEPGSGVIAVIEGGTNVFGIQGKAEADFVIGGIGDKADTIFLGGSTFPGMGAVQQGLETEYKRLCATCKFDALDLPASSIGTTLPATVVAYLASHPSVNYVVLGQASMILGLPEALDAAGAKVKILSNFPSTTTTQQLKDGKIDGIIMLQQGDSMWQMVDALARHFAGVPVEPSMAPSPVWAVTKDNVDKLTGDPYVLISDYVNQYKALWGK